jgi:hypothetical protein
MSMTFYGGEVDDEARDEIRWMELHGLRIEYVDRKSRTGRSITDYYFTIPQRCTALKEVKTDAGVTHYVCGVYETRPEMCRDYDGRMEGPFGVADCLWRPENGGLVELLDARGIAAGTAGVSPAQLP